MIVLALVLNVISATWQSIRGYPLGALNWFVAGVLTCYLIYRDRIAASYRR